MAKLQKFKGHYCESEFEAAFIEALETAGWQYLAGNKIPRQRQDEVLYADDFMEFMKKTNPDFTAEDIEKSFDNLRIVGAESDFAALHKVYRWLADGVQFVLHSGEVRMVSLIDYEQPTNNIFRVVN